MEKKNNLQALLLTKLQRERLAGAGAGTLLAITFCLPGSSS